MTNGKIAAPNRERPAGREDLSCQWREVGNMPFFEAVYLLSAGRFEDSVVKANWEKHSLLTVMLQSETVFHFEPNPGASDGVARENE